MPRAVFDTNIFLRALLNPHSRCGRLLDELADRYELIVSPAIVREILEVLHRPRLRAKFPQLASIDLQQILGLFEQAEVVTPRNVPAVCRDPDDDEFLACAAEGRADFLVTEDRDLLDLGTHQGTRICGPAEFLAGLEAG
jgi:putative PIN family toxin of toxin-antitoxin system